MFLLLKLLKGWHIFGNKMLRKKFFWLLYIYLYSFFRSQDVHFQEKHSLTLSQLSRSKNFETAHQRKQIIMRKNSNEKYGGLWQEQKSKMLKNVGGFWFENCLPWKNKHFILQKKFIAFRHQYLFIDYDLYFSSNRCKLWMILKNAMF